MMRLFLVGAGTPTPTPSRFGTCYIVQVGSEYLMFDCGPAATHKMVKMGLFPTQIGNLFFTHHHYDHNADYACFLLTRWNHETGREEHLRVWGPPPTARLTSQLVGRGGAYEDDWVARVETPSSQEVHLERGGTLPRPAPQFDVKDLRPGMAVGGDGWHVMTAEAQHAQPWLQSLAYRVNTNSGSIVITGDAAPSPPLEVLCRGADTLLVNCWNHQSAMGEGTAISSMIAGTMQAARLAQDAGAARLIVSHSLPALTRPGARERGIADMAQVFKGEIVFGDELMSLELEVPAG